MGLFNIITAIFVEATLSRTQSAGIYCGWGKDMRCDPAARHALPLSCHSGMV